MQYKLKHILAHTVALMSRETSRAKTTRTSSKIQSKKDICLYMHGPLYESKKGFIYTETI